MILFRGEINKENQLNLYILRHGETVYNLENRIQGHKDSPLTPLGIQQAEAAAGRLAGIKFSAIYSSDLGRAYNTAQIIAQYHNCEIEASKLLRERNFGILEGLTRAEIDENYPVMLTSWRKNPLQTAPPKGEMPSDVILRCQQFLYETLSEYEFNENVLVVAHGGTMRGLVLGALFKNPDMSWWPLLEFSNVGLSILEYGNKVTLRLMNDTSHLDALMVTNNDADNQE